MVDLSLHTPVLGQAEGWQWVRWKLSTLKTISSLIYHLPPPPLLSSSQFTDILPSFLSLNKDEVRESKWLSTTSKLVKCWKYQDIAPISISVRKWKDQSKKYHGVFVITDAPPSPSPPLATQSLPRLLLQLQHPPPSPGMQTRQWVAPVKDSHNLDMSTNIRASATTSQSVRRKNNIS